MQETTKIQDLNQKIFNKREKLRGTAAVIDYSQGDTVRLIVKENSRKPGRVCFAREDGKVGFPTINSLQVKIGDVIEGRVKADNPTCFFVDVEKIVQTSQDSKDV